MVRIIKSILSLSNSLAVNAVSSWISLGVSVVITFSLTPYLIHHLGDSRYGIWALLSSIVGMYGLLDLGIGMGIMRYIAYYLGKKDRDLLNATASTAFFMFCCIGLLCILIGFVFAGVLAKFFNLSASDTVLFRESLILIGFSAGIGFPNGVLETILRAHERFVPTNCVRIVCETFRACMCVVALKLGWGLPGVAGASLVAGFATFTANYVVFRHYCKDIRLLLSLVKMRSVMELVKYGIPASVAILASLLQNKLDTSVITKVLGDMRLVTVYAVGAMLVLFLQRFMVSASGVLDPRFGQLSGADDRAAIGALYLRSLAFTTSLAFSAGMTFILAGKALIPLWVGPGYEKSYEVLVILTAGQMVATSQMPTLSVLFAINRHRWFAFMSLAEGAANLGLSIYLARKWGIIGVAAGTTIPMLIFRTIAMPLYAIRQTGVRIRDFYFTVSRPIILLVLIGVLLKFFVNTTTTSWTEVILLCCVLLVGLIAASNWLGISSAHRFTLFQIRQFLVRAFPVMESKGRHA